MPMQKIFFSILTLLLFTACSLNQQSSSISPHSSQKEQALRKANILNNQGVDAYRQGDYPKAIGYYQQSISIKEQILGTEDLNTATSYNNLGLIYKKTKE